MSKESGVKEKGPDTMKCIINNYKQNEEALVKQLWYTTPHATTIGTFREDLWREMFQQIVPKKFVVEQSVFIIDSYDNVSKEVDLAVLDEMYTPYIFRYGSLKFIPIEAVAVVVECKSTSASGLKDWGEKIAALRTDLRSFARIAGRIAVGEDSKNPKNPKDTPSQTATRPLRILCCMDGTMGKDVLKSGDACFDIIIRVPKASEGLKIEFDDSKKNLQDWYISLNHVELNKDSQICSGDKLKEEDLSKYQVGQGEDEVSLLSLNLKLNQLLMLINNPIPFPHQAYAQMFDKYVKQGE